MVKRSRYTSKREKENLYIFLEAKSYKRHGKGQYPEKESSVCLKLNQLHGFFFFFNHNAENGTLSQKLHFNVCPQEGFHIVRCILCPNNTLVKLNNFNVSD